MRSAIVVVLLMISLTGCVGVGPGATPWVRAQACDTIVPLDDTVPVGTVDPTPPLAAAGWRPSFTRDAYGVPQIVAPTLAAAYREAGYATAEDRLWQLEAYRRAATGTLAEVTGPDGVASDTLMRTVGYTPEQRAGLLAAMDPEVLSNIRAYVEGINARIIELEQDPLGIPAEFAALGITPTLWTMDDHAAFSSVFFILGNFDAGSERASAAIYAALVKSLGAGADAAFNDIVPAGQRDAAPVTAPPTALAYPRTPLPAAVPADQRAAVVKAAAALSHAATRPDELTTILPTMGSNWIVLGPEHTATGGAMILGGPQTGFSVPSSFWEADMLIDGVRWHPLSIPGLGGGLGLFGSVALSITVGYGDETDLIVVPIQGTTFQERSERILVLDRTVGTKALADPTSALDAPSRPPREVSITVRHTDDGPVIAYDETTGVAIVQRRAQRGQELAFLDVFFSPRSLDASRNAEDMRAFLDDIVPRVVTSMNWALAYDDGVIEYRHLGRVPARDDTYDRRLPVPELSWAGMWDASCMPFLRDPAQGWLTNWNNLPAQGWPNMAPMPWVWGSEHRVEVLNAAVERALREGPLTMDRLNEAMRDAAQRDAHAHAIALPLMDLAPTSPASAAIRAWAQRGFPIMDADRDGIMDDAGVGAWEVFRASLQTRVFHDELGEADHVLAWGRDIAGANNDDHGASKWGEGVLASLLAGRAQHDWWDDISTPHHESAADQVRAALADADKEMPNAAKRPMTKIIFRDLGAGPALEMPATNRGSINFLWDSKTGELRTILPPGQSGTVSLPGLAGALPNPHRADQVDLFVDFAYK